MPNLIGLPFTKGQDLLGRRLCEAGNNTAIVARTRHTGTAAPGTFVGQSPQPGATLTSVTAIRIYVEEKR